MTTSHSDTAPLRLTDSVPESEPDNLLPRFARRAEEVQYQSPRADERATARLGAPAPRTEPVDDHVAEPIPLRPGMSAPRSRGSRWLALHLNGVLGVLLETAALVVALAAVPFAGNRLLLAVLVVLAVVVPHQRRQRLTLSVLDDLPRMATTVAVATLIAVVITAPGTSVGGATAVAGAVLVAMIVGRQLSYVVTRRLRRSTRFQRRTVVIGSGQVAGRLVESMQAYPEHGLAPHALLDDSPMPAIVASHIPVEPLANQLRAYIAVRQIDTVVIAFSAMRESALLTLLRECDRMDCEIFVVPRLFEFVSVSGDMDRLHAIPLVRIRRDVHRSLAWGVKRVVSSVLAGLAMVTLAPVLALVALAVRLSDPSAPVLFRQIRVTADGRVFECLKFRSMKPASREEADTTWNISQDARIGRLGRFLRATSLDELPQLWNVVKGDMDLVGPRPERPHFVDKFASEIPGYSARHRVPGGLTGWAAVHGLRGDTSLQDRALYDNYYIENWSLWLDAKILLRTVMAVLRRTGG
ncbi:sugar transferase [Rhodococcus kroppenstedtii]|uniref:sugar transferase n=1 Tax=Rhodococcoides kroppenstedtii TaxID=293050 RepID=UPI001BDF1514|nr:sugar transferase [Rhodococcus kroppenstedtii]MBT1191144.1 sugar transferase [Rhodococcus kroppenstedtii]MDV7198360.1 sugar transferase [Rhodococcus kroppenstedtii]